MFVLPTFANFSALILTIQSIVSCKNVCMGKPVNADNKVATVLLVVDDHPLTATTLARAISQLGDGITVISATSGKQALEYANNNTIDVLITDVTMPDMNGLELIEQVQAHATGRPLYTILMTAYDVPERKETTRRLKIHNTILKPVPTERICQIVKEAVDNMRHENSPAKQLILPHRFKIMIADDNPENVSLLSWFMQNEGYDLITASNGVEVSEKAHLEMPDLILLDINMPQKDGFTALKELRADPKIRHIPVIITTAARPSPEDIQQGLNRVPTITSPSHLTNGNCWHASGQNCALRKRKMRSVN